MHWAIVEYPQNVPTLTEAAPQMRDQHLAYRRFIADQLHQLIDAILLQQILRALLLKRQPGIEESESGTLAAPGFRFPGEPAPSLHGVE